MSAHCQQEVCSKFKFSYLIFKSITNMKSKVSAQSSSLHFISPLSVSVHPCVTEQAARPGAGLQSAGSRQLRLGERTCQ